MTDPDREALQAEVARLTQALGQQEKEIQRLKGSRSREDVLRPHDRISAESAISGVPSMLLDAFESAMDSLLIVKPGPLGQCAEWNEIKIVVAQQERDLASGVKLFRILQKQRDELQLRAEAAEQQLTQLQQELSEARQEKQPDLIVYMTTPDSSKRDAAYLRMYAAKVRNGTALADDIPNTIASTFEDMAQRVEAAAFQRENQHDQQLTEARAQTWQPMNLKCRTCGHAVHETNECVVCNGCDDGRPDETLDYDPIVKGAQTERAVIVDFIRSLQPSVLGALADAIENGKHYPALPRLAVLEAQNRETKDEAK